MNAIHAAATELAAQGFRCFPLKSRGKTPATKNGLHDASNDPEQLARWFGKSPELNLAVRTGDSHWVLDVDGPSGEESLAELVAEHGDLPATAEVRTGKGRQLYFTLPADVEIRNRAGVLPGLDVRGIGGYVVAPRSIHPNGKPYVWTRPLAALTAAPEWLVGLVRSRPAEQPPAERNGSHEGNGHGALFARGRQYAAAFPPAGEGTRNQSAFKLGGSLAALEGLHGERLSRADVLTLVRSWNQCNLPPLGDAELVKAVDSSRVNGTPPAAKLPAVKTAAGKQSAAPIEPYAPLPVDVLPEPIRGYVHAGSLAIGCDPSYVALPLLASLAGAIGNTHQIELRRGWCEPAVLWCPIIGDSGTLKSPALDLATDALRELQREAIADYRQRLAEHDEAVDRYETAKADWGKGKPAARGEKPRKPQPPVCTRYVASDVTVEALAALLADNPCGLLLMRDELSGWLHGMNQYRAKGQGADEAHWLTMHGARDLLVDRKTGTPRTIFVERAAVSLTGSIQPAVLASCISDERRESGLLARLLPAMPPRRRKRWTEATVEPSLCDDVRRVFSRLIGLRPDPATLIEAEGAADDDRGPPEPVDLAMTPAAKTAWIGWYNAHAGEMAEMTGDLAAAWSKLEGAGARLGLVLHLAAWAAGHDDEPGPVPEWAVRAGCTLADWFGRETRRVYRVLSEGADDRRRRLLVELIEGRGGRITPRDLCRGSRQYPNVAAAEAVLDALAKAGRGAWESVAPAGGGRESLVFALRVDDRPVSAGKNTAIVDNTNVDTSAEAPEPDDGEEVVTWTA